MLHVTRLSRVAALAAIPISVSAAHADEVRPDQMADLTILEMKAEPAYPHPGEAVRIGLVVRNNAAWYAAFNVQPGEGLYIPPDQRVTIW